MQRWEKKYKKLWPKIRRSFQEGDREGGTTQMEKRPVGVGKRVTKSWGKGVIFTKKVNTQDASVGRTSEGILVKN